MAAAVRVVEVRAGRQRYDVLIGSGLLPTIGSLVRPLFRGARCAVVTDSNVGPLFCELVCTSLLEANFRPELITVPPGESSKSLAQAGALCEQMSAVGLDRSSFLVSLGGGVVGDLAGFVASIYLRGIPYVSVPTTLLAQVDSCIGGKTGVNARAGKNLIGAFHHPALVLADLDTLQTLPERIWHEGFAEVIKHGIIHDAELFEMVAQGAKPDDLGLLVERNLAIKGAIVAADEQERTDVRALLNFGHTIGHAIEHAAAGEMLHGEALSLGLLAAAAVSVRRAGLSLGEKERIRAALVAHHLPITLPRDFPREKIFAALARDKKFENGQIRFVVAHEIGRASLSREVTLDDLEAAVAEL
ncbi:MAG: 3-dehydroquinate synthase [Spartobacteria bacterium]